MGKEADKFFEWLEYRAVTFGDVRLEKSDVAVLPGYSDFLPDEVSLKTRVSTNIWSGIAMLSAPMDTVTEAEFAIQFAKEGGLPVIHRNLTIEEQARHVAQVKHHVSGGFISRPICVYEDETIGEVWQRRKEKGYKFHSLPVLQRKDDGCTGMLTRTHFKYMDDPNRLVKSIMETENLLTASLDTSREEAFLMMRKNHVGVLPKLDNQRKVIGLFIYTDIAESEQRKTGSIPWTLDDEGRLRVGAAIGTGDEHFERAAELVRKNVDLLVIDAAHGDSKSVYDMLRRLKSRFSVDVMAGNIADADATERMCDAGADALRIGLGSSGICTTRVVAGVGCPQLTAVWQSARIAKKYGVPTCADGGIRYSGDMVKAIAAGADSVMIGSLFAGTDEAPGEEIIYQGRKYKEYRGMGSVGAILASKGSRGRYPQESLDPKKIVPEGIEGRVPYRGALTDIVFQLVGGVRSGMGYVGARNIEELHEKARFYLVSEKGVEESHPHDIEIIRDVPNYPTEDDA